ncbi:SMP-30/gluconolactonase/LRE family protein [Nonomuraea sp. C10]|uniref:SMP-30/gluconolactonase/LRE family protein n=1 Tax=Nonomuraea sp. C10 TaxID=2600577 RepID=UPI0037C9BD7F
MAISAHPVTEPVAHHGEGPAWHPRWGGLRWVDMLAGDLLALDAQGRVRRRHAGSLAAVIRPRAGGGFLVAAERELLLADADDLHAPLRSLGEAWQRVADRGAVRGGHLQRPRLQPFRRPRVLRRHPDRPGGRPRLRP